MTSGRANMRGFLCTRACLWALVAASVASSAQSATVENPAERCKALQYEDFSLVQDAPTQIMETKLEPKTSALPSYCEANGYVAPSFGFILRLPSANWNGKLMQVGSGGFGGSYPWLKVCDAAIRRNYACIVSDGGHKSTPLDGKWAYNNPQGPTDYFIRAPHVATLAGKAIVERYYSKSPHKSYLMGCSSGSIQALHAAQRFPWDYDGIVAIGPCLNPTAILLNMVWGNRALRGQNGKALLGEADIELLHKAVVAKCDLNDGIQDGVIGDPRDCKFDPTELHCTGGQHRQCLSAAQLEVVNKIYTGPVTSEGKRIVMPIAQKGSERGWLLTFGDRYDFNYRNFAADWFRYVHLQPSPGPSWQPEDFDFDRDYKRLGMGEAIDAVNPDLRRFKAAGGKFLLISGWADEIDGVLRTADFYETVERVVGSRVATQEFFRLFMIPGVGHCGGGAGASAVDYFRYLEDWVEKGKAPDSLIGAHLEDAAAWFPHDSVDPNKIEFTRPIYPYPIKTRYLGHGDPKDASSFGPVEPSSTERRMK